jgi:hypothetical protein
MVLLSQKSKRLPWPPGRQSPRTIINWRQRGIIPYFRIGRSIRYSREQIDRALLDRHQRNVEALSPWQHG